MTAIWGAWLRGKYQKDRGESRINREMCLEVEILQGLNIFKLVK